jgi:hypothetical protein
VGLEPATPPRGVLGGTVARSARPDGRTSEMGRALSGGRPRVPGPGGARARDPVGQRGDRRGAAADPRQRDLDQADAGGPAPAARCPVAPAAVTAELDILARRRGTARASATSTRSTRLPAGSASALAGMGRGELDQEHAGELGRARFAMPCGSSPSCRKQGRPWSSSSAAAGHQLGGDGRLGRAPAVLVVELKRGGDRWRGRTRRYAPGRARARRLVTMSAAIVGAAELAGMVELELGGWPPGQRRSSARPNSPACSWSSSAAGHRVGSDRRRRARRHARGRA